MERKKMNYKLKKSKYLRNIELETELRTIIVMKNWPERILF
jgi:hypothetical protein